ncbi:MAG: hypothetical protein IH955_04775 [Chloroflexi bacterium]|nr:hypothetical protein [Chloroflexota bacterium]
MYIKGDKVRVRGFGGEVGILRVWEERKGGLMLCSESGYAEAVAGGEIRGIGYPIHDIIGLATEEEKKTH